MKRRLLISLCFALIFVLGGITGWLLKPVPPNVTAVTTGTPGEHVFLQLDANLHFTAAQKIALRPLCEEWGNKAAALRRRPNQSKELFAQYSPRVRELLNTNQLARYDELAAEALARSQQRTRR